MTTQAWCPDAGQKVPCTDGEAEASTPKPGPPESTGFPSAGRQKTPPTNTSRPGISKPGLGRGRAAYGLHAREPTPGMNSIIMAGLEEKCH